MNNQKNATPQTMNVYQGICDLWELNKKYIDRLPADPDDDAFWTDFVQDCSKVGEAHGNHPLINKYVLAFADYVEEVSKCGTTHPEQ